MNNDEIRRGLKKTRIRNSQLVFASRCNNLIALVMTCLLQKRNRYAKIALKSLGKNAHLHVGKIIKAVDNHQYLQAEHDLVYLSNMIVNEVSD